MEDEITRAFHRNAHVDDEEEEEEEEKDQLAHARYQSLEEHRFEHKQ